ncbi:ABC transporter substrate-binding protein [Ornithinibacillus sp. 4-3]|uniref:ABC transporter substrate-binding protein n=1 Tax=Ornithinibacillus sp. 4-3 TaxID=3231488 RepID=A0AB39HQA7_9BACI
MKSMKKGLFILLLVLIAALVGCSSDDNNNDGDNNGSDNNTAGEPQEGGVLKIALDAQPPNMDVPSTPATASRDTGRLIFESLVTTDADYKAVPMLAEEIDISDDSKVYTFKLREGVKFHNGKEMTSEDVVASMERWLEKSTITGTIFNGATWEAQDDYTVVLTLEESSSLTLDTIASAKMASAIMPKEVVESAPAEGVDEYIGTGPYKFVEWKQDQYILFERFDDYQAVEEEASGLSGKKVAYFDEIYFYIVPDTSTRLAGLQTGEYDFAFGMPYDSYDQLLSNDDLDTILTPSANEFIHFNKNHGITEDVNIRKAINAALDNEEIMMAAFPNTDFYWLDSGYMDVNMTNWASEAGSEHYNLADLDLAKEYLKEAGYNNEELRIMVTRDYDHHYNAGVVVHEQLKNAGINAVLDVYDWPTFNDKMQSKLEDWDIFVVSSSTVSTPPQLLALSPTFAGGLDDEKSQDLMKQIETAPTLEEAQALWDELQGYSWEETMPIVNIGGYNNLFGLRANVEGVTAYTGPVFWNAYFTD